MQPSAATTTTIIRLRSRPFHLSMFTYSSTGEILANNIISLVGSGELQFSPNEKAEVKATIVARVCNEAHPTENRRVVSLDVWWCVVDGIMDSESFRVIRTVTAVAASCMRIVRFEKEYGFVPTPSKQVLVDLQPDLYSVRITPMTTPLEGTRASESMLFEMLWQTIQGEDICHKA